MDDQVPGSHISKTDALLAPTLSQYPPGLHDSQAVCPVNGENVPAGHAVQLMAADSVWNFPLRRAHGKRDKL